MFFKLYSIVYIFLHFSFFFFSLNFEQLTLPRPGKVSGMWQRVLLKLFPCNLDRVAVLLLLLPPRPFSNRLQQQEKTLSNGFTQPKTTFEKCRRIEIHFRWQRRLKWNGRGGDVRRRHARIERKKKKRTNLWEDRFDEAIFSMLRLSRNIFITIELVCTRSRIRRFFFNGLPPWRHLVKWNQYAYSIDLI